MKKPEERTYRIKTINRTYWRDGSHPYPGVVTREETSWAKRKLRVWEVEEYGFREAMRRADIRDREAQRRREEEAIRRKYWTVAAKKAARRKARTKGGAK